MLTATIPGLGRHFALGSGLQQMDRWAQTIPTPPQALPEITCIRLGSRGRQRSCSGVNAAGVKVLAEYQGNLNKLLIALGLPQVPVTGSLDMVTFDAVFAALNEYAKRADPKGLPTNLRYMYFDWQAGRAMLASTDLVASIPLVSQEMAALVGKVPAPSVEVGPPAGAPPVTPTAPVQPPEAFPMKWVLIGAGSLLAIGLIVMAASKR